MKTFTFLIEIGNINAQNRYKVKAKSEKEAKAIALKRHKEAGRSLDNKKVYIVLSY